MFQMSLDFRDVYTDGFPVEAEKPCVFIWDDDLYTGWPLITTLGDPLPGRPTVTEAKEDPDNVIWEATEDKVSGTFGGVRYWAPKPEIDPSSPVVDVLDLDRHDHLPAGLASVLKVNDILAARTMGLEDTLKVIRELGNMRRQMARIGLHAPSVDRAMRIVREDIQTRRDLVSLVKSYASKGE